MISTSKDLYLKADSFPNSDRILTFLKILKKKMKLHFQNEIYYESIIRAKSPIY